MYGFDISDLNILITDANLNIKWQDPSDINWTGTKIIINFDHSPNDYTDGILVVDSIIRDQYQIIGFDYTLSNFTRIFIKAFTYTTPIEYSAGVGQEIDANCITNTSILQNINDIEIMWTDPTNSNWTGTKVIKKIGSAPVDENDGTLLEDITILNNYEFNPFVDTNIYNNHCYYGIFPYDNSFIPNYNYGTILDVFFIDQMPTEDIPDFQIIQVTQDSKIEITWTDPTDADWSKTYIVKKENYPPSNIEDGEIIKISTILNEYQVNPLEDSETVVGKTYYYGIFTVDINGNYNNNTIKRIEILDYFKTLDITNMSIFQERNIIKITYRDPVDIDWKSTLIVRNESSEPTDINDGILLEAVTIRNKYISDAFIDIDNFIVGKTYYYGIFTVDVSGNYNYNTVLHIKFADMVPTLNIINPVIIQHGPNVEIKYQDPNSVDWQFTKIIRKEGGIPLNSNDGLQLGNIFEKNKYRLTSFVDSFQLRNNITYYYGLFTCDFSGNYNYNTVLNITFIDLDFPENVSNAQVIKDNSDIKISWADPNNIDWAGTVVVKKENYPPSNFEDGEIITTSLVANQYSDNPFIERNIGVGKLYYYGIFPFDNSGNYNYNTVIVLNLSSIGQNFYNFKITWDETSNPIWNQTYVIKKIDSQPFDVIDGENLEIVTVYNKYSVDPLIDCDIEPNINYFYTLFQYSDNTLLSTINISSTLLPSDVSNINIVQNGYNIELKWTDTNHYSREGVKLIRSIDVPPIDENDVNGILLEDITDVNKYAINPFIDTNMTPNTHYYYGIFSYDVDGNYKYQTIDILFEDFFPTNDITNAAIVQDINKLKINWTDPDNVDWKGTKLIRKINTKPLNETDGELLEDVIIRNKYETTPFIDENVIPSQTYCYGIFPYDNGTNSENINYNYNCTLYKTLNQYIDINLHQNYENIEVKWTDLTFTNWKGSILVRKEGSAPTNSVDGAVLEDITLRNKYEINLFIDVSNFVVGATYYYAVFSYNTNDQFYTYVKYYVNSIIYEDSKKDIINPEAIQNLDVIELSWENPNDPIRTGTRIIRKENAAPIDENDGDILSDITDLNTNSYVDTTAELEKKYYYGIFPYDSNGNFNTNPDNIISVFFEDIIVHNIQNPTIEFKNNIIFLKWEDPDVLDWVGTKIIKKIGSAPIDESDGELLENITIKNKYKIIAFEDPEIEFNNTYYYGIFPYDDASPNPNYNYNVVLSQDLHILSVQNLKISQSLLNEQLYISYEDSTSSNWTRTKIIRKLNGIPVNENDGIVIINSTIKNQYKSVCYIDNGVIPGQYYGYKAITYDRFGNINTIAASATIAPNLIIDFNYERLFYYYENFGWNIITQPNINDSNYIRASGKITKTFTIKDIIVPSGKTGTLNLSYDFYQCYYESKARFKIFINGSLALSLNPTANGAAFDTNKRITLNSGNNTIEFVFYGTKELHFPPYINIYDLKIIYN